MLAAAALAAERAAATEGAPPALPPPNDFECQNRNRAQEERLAASPSATVCPPDPPSYSFLPSNPVTAAAETAALMTLPSVFPVRKWFEGENTKYWYGVYGSSRSSSSRRGAGGRLASPTQPNTMLLHAVPAHPTSLFGSFSCRHHKRWQVLDRGAVPRG